MDPYGSFRKRRCIVGAVFAVISMFTVVSVDSVGAADRRRPTAFVETVLVSNRTDVPALEDDEVHAPIGLALGPGTPLWVVNGDLNEGHDPECLDFPDDPPQPCLPDRTLVTTYTGANGHSALTKLGLELSVQLPSSVVFNPTRQFRIDQGGRRSPATLLFSESKTENLPATTVQVSAWNSSAPPIPTTTVTTPIATPSDFFAEFTGYRLAIVSQTGGHGLRGTHALLLAARINFATTPPIEVYDGSLKRLNRPDAFMDPDTSSSLIVRRMSFLDGRVYIGYSNGAVSVFERDGKFISRLVPSDPSRCVSAMVIAPRSWGRLRGSLLVADCSSDVITAYNPHNGKLIGTVNDVNGKPLRVPVTNSDDCFGGPADPRITDMTLGNGVVGTPDSLLLSVSMNGCDGETTDGLVGLIAPP